MLPLSAAGPSHGEASQSSNHQAPAHPPPTHPPSGDPARCCGVLRGGLQHSWHRCVARAGRAAAPSECPLACPRRLLAQAHRRRLPGSSDGRERDMQPRCGLGLAGTRREQPTICVALLRTKGPPGARWEPAPWRAFVHANASTWPLLADQQATRDRVAGVAPGTRQHASHFPYASRWV